MGGGQEVEEATRAEERPWEPSRGLSGRESRVGDTQRLPGPRASSVARPGAHSPGPTPGAGQQGAAQRERQHQHLQHSVLLILGRSAPAQPDSAAPPGAHHLEKRGVPGFLGRPPSQGQRTYLYIYLC